MTPNVKNKIQPILRKYLTIICSPYYLLSIKPNVNPSPNIKADEIPTINHENFLILFFLIFSSFLATLFISSITGLLECIINLPIKLKNK